MEIDKRILYATIGILALLLSWSLFSTKKESCPHTSPCPQNLPCPECPQVLPCPTCPKCPEPLPSLDKALGTYALPDKTLKTIQAIDENTITLQGGITWNKIPNESFVLTGGDNATCSCSNYCAKDWGNEIKQAKPSWKGSKCGYKTDVYKKGIFQGSIDCDKTGTDIYVGADSQVCYCVEDSTPYKDKGPYCNFVK